MLYAEVHCLGVADRELVEDFEDWMCRACLAICIGFLLVFSEAQELWKPHDHGFYWQGISNFSESLCELFLPLEMRNE